MKRPFPNSYWVEPGKLLAGEHPGAKDEAATRRRLKRLHEAGIRHFFDLTEPGELPGYAALLPQEATWHGFPVPDHSVPASATRMRQLLGALAAAHAGEGGLYVHCRAGIGRTGMAIGCWLREQGAGPDEALAQLNRLWQQNARSSSWPSVPETDEQYHYVQGWQPGLLEQAGHDGQPGAVAGLPSLQRYQGCLAGLALGDALARAGLGEDASAGLRWSDDTAMTLCVVDSLLAREGFDGRDQVERYLAWQRDPAGAGADPASALRPAVRSALLRALRSRAFFQGSLDPSVTDAAPLARAAAAALFAPTPAQAGPLAVDITRVTHQAAPVVDSCRLLACLLAQVLEGTQDRLPAVHAAIDAAQLARGGEVAMAAQRWGDARTGRHPAGPAVLVALDGAVRAFLHADDAAAGFERLRRAPGTDPDATGAVFGALAGAWQGPAGLPGAALARLEGRERLEALAAALHARSRASRDEVP